MKKLIFLLAPVLMTACVKSASDYDTPENPEKPWNEFDFTTSAVTSLSLDYAADAAVYFEIYERSAGQMRLLLGEEGYTDTEVREDLNGKPRMVCSRMK